MKKRRIAAGIVAVALLVGSVGVAVINSSGTSERTLSNTDKSNITNTEYNFAYGIAQSLYFKINELWRLSINSDLSMETATAISVLNSGFDSELLEKAIIDNGDEVIDEYIYAVLSGLDFELYLEDRAAYDKAKDEMQYTGEILTQEAIDKYLNQVNEETAKTQVNEAINSVQEGVDVPTPGVANGFSSAMPQSPYADSVLPENPADAIRKETDAITNQALGIEVR